AMVACAELISSESSEARATEAHSAAARMGRRAVLMVPITLAILAAGGGAQCRKTRSGCSQGGLHRPVDVGLRGAPSPGAGPHPLPVLPDAASQPAGPVRLDPGDHLAGDGIAIAAARRLEAHQHLVQHHLVEDVDAPCPSQPFGEAAGQCRAAVDPRPHPAAPPRPPGRAAPPRAAPPAALRPPGPPPPPPAAA